ncbi:MAG: threonine dehydratase [Gemmatimonadaceae bacterium]|nr:threonine dehydratase [Gemmatimonadaceae bacterium]
MQLPFFEKIVPHDTLPNLAELDAASALIAQSFAPTPQIRWPLLEARLGTRCWVKHENHTPVGAFKVRGGLVYFDWLRRMHPEVVGVVTATRGNHGQSIGYAAQRIGVRTCVAVPHGNSVEKNAAMRALGAELIEGGDDFQESVELADRIAEERGWHRVPSFHRHLVAGVGTYAMELLRAAPDVKTLYVPIGLGSGACGVIAAKAALGHSCDVVGIVSTEAPAYARSLELGAPVSMPANTRIADGMACRTPVPASLDVLKAGLSRVVLVSDDEVEAAMRHLFSDTHNAAEGAGAAALAAALQERGTLADEIAVILCGGNVDRPVFARVLSTD